jgi:hypothetical protein
MSFGRSACAISLRLEAGVQAIVFARYFATFRETRASREKTHRWLSVGVRRSAVARDFEVPRLLGLFSLRMERARPTIEFERRSFWNSSSGDKSETSRQNGVVL